MPFLKFYHKCLSSILLNYIKTVVYKNKPLHILILRKIYFILSSLTKMKKKDLIIWFVVIFICMQSI